MRTVSITAIAQKKVRFAFVFLIALPLSSVYHRIFRMREENPIFSM